MKPLVLLDVSTRISFQNLVLHPAIAGRTTPAATLPKKKEADLLPLRSVGARPVRTSAVRCGFNRSMQHIGNCVGRRSVADEVSTADLLHGQPEGACVGALEARSDPSPDRWFVRSTPYV